MNTKSKTVYDVVPARLLPRPIRRFKSLEAALEYIMRNHLQGKWIIVKTTIEL